MNNIPKDCCGCEACSQVCPKHCITMQLDKEGFLYPVVDKTDCIDCHLCKKVCPVINRNEPNLPIEVCVATSNDENVRLNSSSGGIFTALAERVIEAGGVVFGAMFDGDWNVIHGYVEEKAELERLRGSKYVQSHIGNSYREAEQFLKQGRQVLFSGTPCQIAGLRRFLRKQYENLLMVDVICHGVPSPGVWKRYLREEVARQCDPKNTVLPRPIHGRDAHIEGISFRDKTLGWEKFSFALVLSTTDGRGEKFSFCSRSHLHENPFLKGFIADLFLRPSCYHCAVKNFSSGSDLTLADGWGIWNYKPEWDDDKGTSCVVVLSEKGKQWLKKADIKIEADDIKIIEKHNPAAFISPKMTNKRRKFFKLLQHNNVDTSVDKCLPPPTYWDKIMWSIKKRLKIG